MIRKLSRETIVRRSDRVPFSQLDDEILAIDVESGFLYSLNETGGQVWEAIAQATLVSDVCGVLVETYEVDQAACERAVIGLLEQLCEAGLVEVVGDTR